MRVQCPQCGSAGNIPDEKIPAEGRKIVCPKCKTSFMVNKPTPPVEQAAPAQDATAVYQRGVQLLKEKQVDAAIQELTAAIRLNPKHQEAHRYLGLAYGQKNSWGEAITVLQKAVAYKPDDLLSLKNLGIAFLRQNRFEDAEQTLQQALRYAPNDEHTQSYLKMAARGKQQAAPTPDANEAAANEPMRERRPANADEPRPAPPSALYNPVQEYLNKGTDYLEKGQFGKAIEAFEEAVRLAPESSDGYFGLGMVFEKQQEWKKAIEAYQKAVSINPQDTLAKDNLKYLKKRRTRFRWPWQKT